MRRLPIWELSKRVALLEDFLRLSREYFQLLNFDQFGQSSETPKSLRLRTQLNSMVGRAELYVKESDTPVWLQYQQPAAVGGAYQNINLIESIFYLPSNRIDPQFLIDTVERAIADYTADRFKSKIRAVNPFYWLSVLINAFASAPFALLSSAGFNGRHFQTSTIGMWTSLTMRIVGWLVAFLSGGVTILNAINKMNWVNGVLGFE